jgi:hypothetical protein
VSNEKDAANIFSGQAKTLTILRGIAWDRIPPVRNELLGEPTLAKWKLRTSHYYNANLQRDTEAQSGPALETGHLWRSLQE